MAIATFKNNSLIHAYGPFKKTVIMPINKSYLSNFKNGKLKNSRNKKNYLNYLFMYQYTASAPTIQIILCPFVIVNESTII